jgi:hypothetical protein
MNIKDLLIENCNNQSNREIIFAAAASICADMVADYDKFGLTDCGVNPDGSLFKYFDQEALDMNTFAELAERVEDCFAEDFNQWYNSESPFKYNG